jgi:[CysO sulfur-carrier protein]-S-L-cysteine hydrolase
VRIPRALIDEIVAHSRDVYPVPNAKPREECCGLLGGAGGEVTSVHRARNAAATWLRYEVHPSDQIRIMDQIDADGEELVGIYHSHTNSEAYPSQTDVNLAANWPGLLWLICSLEDHDDPVVRGFRIDASEVEEEDLDVV